MVQGRVRCCRYLFWRIYVFKITIFGPLSSSICSGYPEPLQRERIYSIFFDIQPKSSVCVGCKLLQSRMVYLLRQNEFELWNDTAFVDFLKNREVVWTSACPETFRFLVGCSFLESPSSLQTLCLSNKTAHYPGLKTIILFCHPH